MAKTATYSLISSQTVSGVSSVSFTSIPSTFTDLKVVYVGYNDAPLVKIGFNTDAGNQSVCMLMGNGSTAASARYGTPYLYVWTPDANAYFTFAVNVFDYANTTTYKSWLSRCDIAHGAGGPTLAAGTWRSTAAINSIQFATSSLTMTGTFRLYGIEAYK
jgi:hypothetical protein